MPFDYTDAWHPTVNPSARMPVHHHRHLHALGHMKGTLNEFPRRRGGTTIRLPRMESGRLHVIQLPGSSTFAPWWLPASDSHAIRHISSIYSAALRHSAPTPQERGILARLHDDFEHRCARNGEDGLTVGEALWRAADALHRELVPSLPEITLTSLTRSPARHTLANALRGFPGGPLTVLMRWAERENRAMWPLLAVATSPQGVPLRVRAHARRRHLDVSPLPIQDGTTYSRGRPAQISEDDLIEMIDTGRLIPGSRLTALAAAAVHLSGTEARHFGNTYGSFSDLSDLLTAPEVARIPVCQDDADSWHYADLPHGDTGRYPLHLIELAACSADVHADAETLINASMANGAPIPLELKGDLDATIRGGRARLLR